MELAVGVDVAVLAGDVAADVAVLDAVRPVGVLVPERVRSVVVDLLDVLQYSHRTAARLDRRVRSTQGASNQQAENLNNEKLIR